MIIRKIFNNRTDCDFVYELSNDSLVRENSFNINRIEYTDHLKWFERTVSDSNTLFFLVFDGNDFVGQIRFNRKSEQSTECVISLSITKDFRGKHIARAFLELGIEEMRKNWHTVDTIVAEVKGENASSNALFLKEGFKLVSSVNTYKYSVS